jgi:glycosyltransferase involved in cell wall biosynthesis
MVIIHLANISNSKYNGVNVVVPQYIINQSKYADVLLLNLNNIKLDSLDEHQYKSISITDKITELDFPFSNPDLVIIHGIYDLKVLSYYLIHIKNKLPYISIPHGGLTFESQKKSNMKKKIVNLFVFKKYFLNAEVVQFLSNIEKNESLKYYRKAIVAGNGINVQNNNLYSVKKRDIFKFVYIGRLELNHKGLDMMLEAINLNKKFLEENNVTFYLCGIDYNKTYDYLVNYINNNLLDKIVSIDKKGAFGIDKINKLLDADFFIQTSRLEGLSLAILEVLSLGIPSLITEGVGMGKIYKEYDCGIVANNNAESISKKIEEACLLPIEVRKDMSKNAFLLSKKFEWDYVTQKTIKLYSEVINEIKNK